MAVVRQSAISATSSSEALLNRQSQDLRSLDSYRDQVSRLLELVEEENLAPIDRDALATGIRVARRTGDELELPKLQRQQPRTFVLGERILSQLIEAEAETQAWRGVRTRRTAR